jgi:ketosteroid isomerase-like protein
MGMTADEDPMTTIDRLVAFTNAHDLPGVVSCFAEDYALDAPLHPSRSFRGREQVHRNWSQIFAAVPDIAAKVVAHARDGAAAWTEWEMAGTRRDGTKHLMRGIFVFVVREGLICSGRMFLEPVEQGGGDMDAAVRAVAQGKAP